MPIDPKFLTELRELTRQHGVVLIFDEVVTGFRVSPGGAQAEYGIRPDLTTLAKILAGGLPGGAVAGRKDILDLLDFQVTKAADREKITHQGTFNANPLSAAAGVAALEDRRHDRRLRSGQPLRRYNSPADQRGVRGRARAVGGLRHVFELPHLHQSRPRRHHPTRFDPKAVPAEAFSDKRQAGVVHKFRLAMMNGGVDFSGSPGGVTSATHGEAELEDTAKALRNAVRMLKQEGEI